MKTKPKLTLIEIDSDRSSDGGAYLELIINRVTFATEPISFDQGEEREKTLGQLRTKAAKVAAKLGVEVKEQIFGS